MIRNRLIAPTLLSLTVWTTACGDGSFLHDKVLGRKDHSSSGANACARPDVKHVDVPRYYAEGASAAGSEPGTVSYAFQYIPPATPDTPTVVYIPGGPGQTSIGEQDDWLQQLPAGYGLVLTDPRGVGCNYVDPTGLKLDFLRSDSVAKDVLAAVANLQLKNYVIYGISYGTVVATIAGSLAEQGDWPKPQSVILEGVLGRALVDDEADDTYRALFAAKLAKLAADHGDARAAAFRGSSLPLGRDADDWLAALRTGLMIGATTDSKGAELDVAYALMERATSDQPEETAWAKNILDSLTGGVAIDAKGAGTFYEYIACREIFANLFDISLKGGDFVTSGDNQCTAANLRLDRPYDPKNWPIKAPVYYLEGKNDPATPAPIARNHFDSETTSPGRQFLLVGDAGHNPFSFTMQDCMPSVWSAMTTGKGLAESVATCTWSPGFELSTEKDGQTTTQKIVKGAASSLSLTDDRTAAAEETEHFRLKSFLRP